MRSDLTSWLIRGMGVTVGAAIVIAIIALGFAAASVLLLMFLSILLASALEPIVGWLRVRLRLGRAGTILVVYASFFVLVLAFAFIVVPAAVNQAERILASLPPFFDEVRGWAANLRPTALSTSITALVDSVDAIFAPAPPPDADEVVEVGTAVAEA
ncbi:MAG: AI-2E family transporter, partial [Candidatus Limnocylindrales bacterium]